MKKTVVLGLISVLLFSLPVCAEPLLNPNNGHYYERITGTITWVNAKTAAESMSHMGVSGHLATVTSYEENWWIVENLGGELTLDHWLGGYLDTDGNWKWVTGEPWGFTSWWNGYGWTEPSGDGNAIEYDDAEQDPPLPGYWNDLDQNNSELGFIVEFDTQFPPTAQCGADQVVFDEVTLDGSASFDPDGWIESYKWTLKHRTTAITIEATGEKPTITGLEQGFYDVRLTVTDNNGATDLIDSLLAAAGSCSCTPTHKKEKGPRCTDGLDNDCDGMIDSEDPDCQ